MTGEIKSAGCIKPIENMSSLPEKIGFSNANIAAQDANVAAQDANATARRENTILPDFGRIAFYLRLSTADGDLGRGNKDESNSIENQRLLLREFLLRRIKRKENFVELIGKDVESSKQKTGSRTSAANVPLSWLINSNPLLRDFYASIFEYVDDGYSGINFDRPSFKRMIEDAKKHKINTIIVKDISRLGRDYIEVGGYMEQVFPLLNIRFIAVNSNYDSDKYRDTTAGIEIGIMNLVNAEYSRDLSRKVRSARRTLWKQGISTSGMAPFGYMRVDRKYVPDPVTAPTVRRIFEKAIEGWDCPRIVGFLNEKGIPTPGAYRQKTTGYSSGCRVVSDEEWLWDVTKVHRILKNYSYTGAMVHGKYISLSVGSNKRRKADPKDWYIIEGAHEAIVSAEEWKEAQGAIKRIEKTAYRNETDFCLKGKLRCGNCGLMMEYRETAKSVVYCGHAKSVGKASACCRTRHEADWIITVVTAELHRQMRMLELLELSTDRNNYKKNGNSYANLKKRTESELEIFKNEKIRQYEAYAEGVISRETYLKKRDEITERIARLEEKLQKALEACNRERKIIAGLAGLRNESGGADEMREGKKSRPPLTRETVEMFINVVRIYDEKTIEVSFNFEDAIKREMDLNQEECSN